MARRPSHSEAPQRPIHSVQEKRKDIVLLQRRIDELRGLDTRGGASPSIIGVEVSIDETLSRIYGKGSADYNRYVDAATLDHGPIAFVGGQNRSREGYVEKGRHDSIALLTQAIKSLEEEIEMDEPLQSHPTAAMVSSRPSTKIFVVHGHDIAAREAVARFIQVLELEPVILHEQANEGYTIIEKFERHADVGFAVVLLTPDDEVVTDAGNVKHARQNVVLELGYFIGKLGRKRVCALKKEDVALPSDIIGVVYTTFDSGDAWKLKLAKELKVAGYSIDMNKAL